MVSVDLYVRRSVFRINHAFSYFVYVKLMENISEDQVMLQNGEFNFLCDST